MVATHRPFKSIEEIKVKGEFFPKGRIIPKRILSTRPRSKAHLVTFGADSWAFPTPLGYAIFTHIEPDSGDCSVRLRCNNAEINGSPYTVPGATSFYNDGQVTSEKSLETFNDVYMSKFLGE
jgi:hypothetical protein